uniref:ENTH domain-containing protein n=1 Tax=Candidozyma auris TaxID=498019 RepID=A0A0L0P767_CANAR
MSKIVRSIKNVANGYLSAQILVRNATSNDPSGPTTYEMEEIAAATYNNQTEFLEIMDMLDRRLNDKGKNWRHVAKSLTVLDYLVRFGSTKCVLWSKDNLYIIKTLREFVHFDDANNDQGAIIRVKAKELVALLRDDERLARERENARAGGRRREGGRRRPEPASDDPYDSDLQRALELSRETAEEEQGRQARNADADDPELQAALKLSLEEEEMRKLKNQQNENLLDLNDNNQGQFAQPQYYYQTGQFQPQFTQPYQFYQPVQQQQQYDIFGNPIQAMASGYYAPQQLVQPQAQPQIPQFTGFTNPAPANNQEELKPLKTGSNNPFALHDSLSQQQSQPQTPSLNQMSQNQQPSYFTQPVSQPQNKLKQQTTSSSRFNETHELNNLLASGTGVDTFGNTGATRIPHQHTKTGTFINSSGTGYKQQQNDVRLSSNATGNPFLNTGIGATGQNGPQYQAQNGQLASRIDPAPTGFGFGNSKEGEPSLIDI